MNSAPANRVLTALGEALTRRSGPLLPPLVDGLCVGLVNADAHLRLTDRGWPAAFDLNETPNPTWLGLVTGTEIPFGLTLEQTRAYVRERTSWRRGTPGAMLAAARATYPVGMITLLERDGSPWRATVRIYDAEATEDDLARVKAAVEAQKPVGIVLSVVKVTGATYAHMLAQHPTYADSAADFATYRDAVAHVPEEGTIP